MKSLVQVENNFTGESGDVPLVTHTPNITGIGWSEVLTAMGCTYNIDASDGNAVASFLNNYSSAVITLSEPNPALPDYAVEIDTGSMFTQNYWNTYILGRYQDNNNFYAVQIVNYYINRTVTLYKFDAGVRTKLGEKTVTTVADFTIKLELRGTEIKVYVDGTEQISVTDSTHSSAGSAGIGSGSLMGQFGRCQSGNQIKRYTVTQLN